MDFSDLLKQKIFAYKDPQKSKEWLSANVDRVRELFENHTLRDFVFEPFKEVFQAPAKTIDANIYAVITQVALINAVLAGLPGKMGVGVWVSVAFEGWMAYSIARHVGIRIQGVSDVWKYMGTLAASFVFLLYGFRFLLGFAFSLFSVILPVVNPLILAEVFITDLVGVLFWIGFEEVKREGSFTVPKRMYKKAGGLTKGLFEHQMSFLKNVFSLQNIKTVYGRIVAYIKGDFPVDTKVINGETFSTVAMAYLISGHYEKLRGPLGEKFIDAIRLRWSSQFADDTSIEEIAERFREYDPDQLEGAINTVKGKMFEILAVEKENLDGDNWYAQMHTDETFPGSDIVFSNMETGEQIEVSLKAVDDSHSQVIEHALARYPDISIMSTDEMAALYEEDHRVFGSGFTNEELDDITREKFDELLQEIEPVNEHQVVISGVVVGTIAALWPFVMAYLRKRITNEQLTKVFKKILGDQGVKIVSRISYATVFGPVFAWYLLAKNVKGIVGMGQSQTIKRCAFHEVVGSVSAFS